MNRGQLQNVFDRVVEHARKQGCKSQNAIGDCYYRGPNGTKCFIDALIENEDYNSKMEGYSVSDVRDKISHSLGFDLSYKDIRILNELRRIHDYDEVYQREDEFRNFSDAYKLVYTSPKNELNP